MLRRMARIRAGVANSGPPRLGFSAIFPSQNMAIDASGFRGKLFA
jgi:hypothetical protein